GTNLPITRTPDAHFMVEARYHGQKVVVVSPDYSDHTKFADDWLAAAPGTAAALGMAMAHVVLTELFRDRLVPYVHEYVHAYTDLEAADGGTGNPVEDGEHKPVMLNQATGAPTVPNGSLGFRFSESGKGNWNLDLEDIDPALSVYDSREGAVTVDLPRFDVGETEGGSAIRRGLPVRRVAGHLVTTVFDLLMAQYAVAREGLPGQWPRGYDDPHPYTPAWQEQITS